MDVLEAHGQAMTIFDRAVHEVEPGQWDGPTPCTDWTVTDLVNHLVYEQLWVPELLAGATMAEVGDRYDGDQLGAEPVAAWEKSATTARGAWLEPGAIERTVHLSFGDTSATEYCWQMTVDLAVHGWDLATAVGVPHRIGDDLAGALIEVAEPAVAHWQGAGIFDPPVPVPGDAPPAERLVALLGRRP